MYRVRPLAVIWVDLNYNGTEEGTESRPYNTVQEALDAAGAGTQILVRTGDYAEGPKTIFKRGRIDAVNGPVWIR